MSNYRNTRDEKQQHLGDKGELRQRTRGFWFPPIVDWLEIAILALTDPCIKRHDEKQLQRMVFVIAYVWKHVFSVSLCHVCDHRNWKRLSLHHWVAYTVMSRIQKVRVQGYRAWKSQTGSLFMQLSSRKTERLKSGTWASNASICDLRLSVFRFRSSPLLHFLWHICDRILMIGLLRLNCYLTLQTPHTYTYILSPYRKFLSVFSLKSFHSESYLLWHILRTLHFCLQACFWLVAGSTDTFNSGKSQLWIYTAKCFFFFLTWLKCC